MFYDIQRFKMLYIDETFTALLFSLWKYFCTFLLNSAVKFQKIFCSGETEEDIYERHERFTCAVANLIQSTPSSMQKILEESTNARLESLKKLLDMASGQMKNELTMVDSYKEKNEAKIQEVMTNSFSPSDAADDLLPPDSFAELSLSQIQLDDGELLDDLVATEVLEGDKGGDTLDDSEDPWSSDYILGWLEIISSVAIM